MKHQATVLDIGSSKVTVLVGERGVNQTFVVKAFSEIPYDGYYEGEFLNVKSFADAVKSALESASESTHCVIDTLYVGVPGEFVRVETKEHKISFPRRKKIRAVDVDDLFDRAFRAEEIDGYTMINRSGIYFVLDDNRRVAEPEGEVSDRLGGMLSYMLANRYFTDVTSEILRENGVKNVEYVSSSLATSLFLFLPEERDRIAILADVGYISSTLSVVCGDGIVYQTAFSFGGGHLSALLSEEFELSFAVAEKLCSIVNLSCNPGENDVYQLYLDEGEYTFSKQRVNACVRRGLDEICEKLSDGLDGCTVLLPEYISVSLTGGGISFMRGAKEYVSTRINRVVEVVRPSIPHLNKPTLSSELGLLDLALGQKPAKQSFFKKLFR